MRYTKDKPIFTSSSMNHDGCLCEECLARLSGNTIEILRRQLDRHTIKTDIEKLVDELVAKFETM